MARLTKYCSACHAECPYVYVETNIGVLCIDCYSPKEEEIQAPLESEFTAEEIIEIAESAMCSCNDLELRDYFTLNFKKGVSKWELTNYQTR